MQDFLRPWQLPLMAAFVVLWLTGGTYLVRRALMRFANPSSYTKVSLGRALGVNFICQGAALAAMAVVTVALLAIGWQLHAPALYVFGPLLGAAVMLVTSYVVHWAVVELPGAKLARMVATTSGPLLALAVVVTLALLLPVLAERRAGAKMAACQDNLARINDALERYGRRSPGRPPASLQALVDEGYLKPEEIVCPASTLPGSYLYAPLAAPDREKASRQIRVADRKGNHGGERLVLFQDQSRRGPYVDRLSEEDFQKLAREPQNSHILPLVEREK